MQWEIVRHFNELWMEKDNIGGIMRNLICKRHPKYKGDKKPKVKCVECWVIYLRDVFNQLNKVIEEDNRPKYKITTEKDAEFEKE